jgi:predicted transposase/invertase (TIGR01784 family)
MEFFVPGSEKDIDWNKKIRFLDKEFQKITKDSELGRRYTDKLVEVTLKNNTKKWILIHIEIQAGKEEEFSERMFVYNYRIFDRFKIPVTSIAVLADDFPSWNPQPFQYGMWGSVTGCNYIKTKLLDYKTNWSYLESRNNPFAIVVMAHLKALDTNKDNSLRKQWKFELTKLLYEKGYLKKEVLNLYSFIDWVLNLPTELEETFLQELNIYEKEKKMPYVTNAERIGEHRGRKGELLSIIANAKQEGLSPEQTARITGLDTELVKKIMNNEETDIPLHLLDK